MNSFAHDLFLLMVNLSQVKSRDRILVLYTNALNSILNNLSLHFIDNDIEPTGEYIEIGTTKYSFGKLVINGNLTDKSTKNYKL